MKILTKKMLAGKNFQRFSYPKDMDKEMIDFMDVLNSIPGCRTLFCCQGHGHGSWYFVANCCNEVPYNAIETFFSKKAMSTKSLIEVEADGIDTFTGTSVPERCIAIYDHMFDLQTPTEKRKSYREMCEYFLEYVPRKHW